MHMETKIAWLAGIIDGEGSIGLAKVNHKKTKTGYTIAPSIQISTRDKRILDEVARILEFIGAKNSYTSYTRHENEKWADDYQLHDGRHADIIKIIEAVRPYLVSKGEQADIVLEFCKSRLGKHRSRRRNGKFVKTYDGSELVLYEKLRPLNKKGKRNILNRRDNP